ncbi:RNA-binding protein [Marinicrinis lubricantis]|uniref:RNA-binding protein n=1 Tax=Marinicrinis lubricantis TaxID=2086470 RepID=A0ABW1IS91_9BACL
MDDSSSIPKIGQLVRIIRGRDQGKIAVMIGKVDDRFVLIADGDKRKFDQPKKKNVMHLEVLDEISPEVTQSINETGRVTNGKLRFVINRFVNEQIDAQKGE